MDVKAPPSYYLLTTALVLIISKQTDIRKQHPPTKGNSLVRCRFILLALFSGKLAAHKPFSWGSYFDGKEGFCKAGEGNNTFIIWSKPLFDAQLDLLTVDT